LFAALLVVLAGPAASAQIDVPDALKNRPPVAAPTMQIDVAPIEVVRSMSELINDFGGGLLQGLLAGQGPRRALLVAAQDNRIIVTRDFGCCVSFDDLLYSDFVAPLAVLQLIERRQLRLEDKVSDIVADYGASDITVAQALSYQTDATVLRRIVESSSGQDFRSYVSDNILSPLVTQSGSEKPEPFPEVMGRLLVALLNGGAFEGRQLFRPETVELMQETQFSIHPALPGWTYGFAEMRRNGRRALQRDGAWPAMPDVEARMVLAPEARVAYFVVVDGRAGPSFWRAFDDALFDRILPRENPVIIEASATPAPAATQARALAGSYEASDGPLSAAAPLMSAAERLVVRAGDDGSLRLSGSENAVLMPQPGGYWAAADGNLNAVASDSRLVLSRGIYRPLRWWKRPALYASLALLSAFGAAGAFVGKRRAQKTPKAPSTLVLALASAVAVFLVLTLFVWHLSPVL
jgi:hypothetical protein